MPNKLWDKIFKAYRDVNFEFQNSFDKALKNQERYCCRHDLNE